MVFFGGGTSSFTVVGTGWLLPVLTVVGTGVPVVAPGVPLVTGVNGGVGVNRGSVVADGPGVTATVGVPSAVGEPTVGETGVGLLGVAVGVWVSVPLGAASISLMSSTIAVTSVSSRWISARLSAGESCTNTGKTAACSPTIRLNSLASCMARSEFFWSRECNKAVACVA